MDGQKSLGCGLGRPTSVILLLLTQALFKGYLVVQLSVLMIKQEKLALPLFEKLTLCSMPRLPSFFLSNPTILVLDALHWCKL